MSVRPEFHDYVIEQLGRVADGVTSRRMFGGVGVYATGAFFAILDDDTLYFKVSDATRGDFEAAGMEPFRPYKDGRAMMAYFEVPAEVLEDVATLREWTRKAIDVARAKAAKPATRAPHSRRARSR